MGVVLFLIAKMIFKCSITHKVMLRTSLKQKNLCQNTKFENIFQVDYKALLLFKIMYFKCKFEKYCIMSSLLRVSREKVALTLRILILKAEQITRRKTSLFFAAFHHTRFTV